jgi:hypothetical protein
MFKDYTESRRFFDQMRHRAIQIKANQTTAFYSFHAYEFVYPIVIIFFIYTKLRHLNVFFKIFLLILQILLKNYALNLKIMG